MWTRRELPAWLRVALLAALVAFATALASPAPGRWADAEDSEDALQDLQGDYSEGDSAGKEVEGAMVNVELTQFDYADACSALARARWTWLLAGERGSGPEEAAVWERETALAASARDNVGFMKTFADLREKVPSAPAELVDQVEYALQAGDLLLQELQYLQKVNYTRAVQQALSDLRVPCHEDAAATAASEVECVMTQPVVRRVLARSGDAAQQLRAWRGAQEALRPLAAAFPAQLALARAAATANGAAAAPEGSEAEDGAEGAGAVGAYWQRLQDPDEYLELTFARARQLWEELRPLHRRLAAYVRERLRKAYGDAALATAGPVPAHGEPQPLPAHLTGSLVGDDWSSLADLVFPGSRLRRLDHALRDKGLSGLRLYEAAYDTLNTSLGVEGLPRSALLAQVRWHGECPAQLVFNCSSGLPRALTCADSGWLQYAEAHEVLTRLAHAYLGAEEDSKALLREVTRYSATHDVLPGVVRLLSLHPDRLLELEVLPDEDEEAEDEEEATATAEEGEDDGGSDVDVERGEATLRLLTALRVLPRAAYLAAADAFRLRLLAAMADAGNSNASTPVDPVALWSQVRREYMLLAPPAGEEQGDAGWLADPALASNVPLLGRFAAEVLVFQALEQLASYDPSHPLSATNQDASLGPLMQLGRSRKWAELINDYLNINEIRIQPLLRYFRPLSPLLTPAAAARAPAAAARAAVDLTPPAPPPPAPPSSADPFHLADPFSSAAAPEPSAHAPASSALAPTAEEQEEASEAGPEDSPDAAPPTAPVAPAAPSATSDIDEATARTAVLAASLTIFAVALAAGALVGGRHVMKKRHYQRNRRPDARTTPKPASENGDVEAAVDPETEPANPSAHA